MGEGKVVIVMLLDGGRSFDHVLLCSQLEDEA